MNYNKPYDDIETRKTLTKPPYNRSFTDFNLPYKDLSTGEIVKNPPHKLKIPVTRQGGKNIKDRPVNTNIYIKDKAADFIFNYLKSHLTISTKKPVYILDACSGKNRTLGYYLFLNSKSHNDVNIKKTLHHYDSICNDGVSILDFEFKEKYDFIVCNPPWQPVTLAADIYFHLLKFLKDDGVLFFLINNTFCYQGFKRAEKLLFQKFYFIPRYVFSNNIKIIEDENGDKKEKRISALDCGVMVYHKNNKINKEAINLNCFIPIPKNYCL